MTYSINKLAKLAGVSVRTLHYYDEIDLLKPSYSKENGYRFYDEEKLITLQQILFYRELEFPLEQIKEIINSKHFKVVDALNDQMKLLKIKRSRMNNLLNTINRTITSLESGKKMKNDDLFVSFSDKQMEQYKKEAKERWGNTNAYKQSAARTKNWTKADYKRIQEAGIVLTKKLADAMDKDIKSPEVQKLIAEHHKGITVFYDCSYQMYRGLGEMYISDARFTATYEKFRPGLAKWLQKAIAYYCDINEEG